MINHVPSNYTSMEVLRLAQDENPNPSPVLEALFKRCQQELSNDAPLAASSANSHRRVMRATVK